jgi:hypothetical protein
LYFFDDDDDDDDATADTLVVVDGVAAGMIRIHNLQSMKEPPTTFCLTAYIYIRIQYAPYQYFSECVYRTAVPWYRDLIVVYNISVDVVEKGMSFIFTK